MAICRRRVKRIDTILAVSLRGFKHTMIHSEADSVAMELWFDGVYVIGQEKDRHFEKMIPFSNILEVDLYPEGLKLLPIDRV